MKTGELNGRMITLAREFNGITQSVLAENVPNLKQSILSQLEVGALNVTYEMWENIARYFKLPVSFFTQELPKTPIASFYFRKRLTMPKKQLTILEAKIDVLRISIDKLLDIVEIPEFRIPFFDVDYSAQKERNIADCARRVREFLNIGKGPISNLVGALEKNGVIVYFINTPNDKFDGYTLFTNKVQPILFVNSNIPNDRKRFTIAHELGHLVLHIRTNREDLSRDVENEANMFASEFLMPELDIRSDLSFLTLAKVAQLKDYWMTSKSSIIRRARDLKMIDQSKYTYFNIELSRRGERKIENGYVSIDKPSIIKAILFEIRKADNLTTDDFASMLSISNDWFKDLYEQDKLRIAV